MLECARLSHDPHFGLHLIHHIDITSYGAYGYLLLSTPTVRSFFEVAQRYYPTFYRGAELALTVSADGARLEYRVTGLGSASQRHDNEWTLAFFVNFIRSRLEFAWYPRRVKFSNPPPGDLGELRREFGDHILFDQPETSFELEPDILDVRISNSDPRLLAILQQHADELLQAALASDSFEHQVRLVILERLKSGLPSADSIARSSSMSLSTLKRRLRETGLSYRDLRDGVVREVSERLLRETDPEYRRDRPRGGILGAQRFRSGVRSTLRDDAAGVSSLDETWPGALKADSRAAEKRQKNVPARARANMSDPVQCGSGRTSPASGPCRPAERIPGSRSHATISTARSPARCAKTARSTFSSFVARRATRAGGTTFEYVPWLRDFAERSNCDVVAVQRWSGSLSRDRITLDTRADARCVTRGGPVSVVYSLRFDGDREDPR